ncbi:Protein PELOTA [Seminavis robusta]|uniref:Protein pelota homolog n=1 Tax=Seminavis robusta TaxID=568900 RepID=A0A9N8DZI0_9STRA|nr:Protein PELOTA [Seminavis robusta]|eukprot:Sro477_g150720.1 Protein PELOTA (413) ;mRNA; r:16593-17938
MKILKKTISAKDGQGTVLLRPETDEDLWHAYNLLQEGDLVRCTTVRKVVKESSTGSTTSSKKRLMLTIKVERIEFDSDVLEVRLSGTNVGENELVRLGAYHTLTLEKHQNFSIDKDCWDPIFLGILDEAANPDQQAEVAAVVMQPGLAHVCLITGNLTVTKGRIETNIPKKRTGSSQQSKAIQRFFNAVYQSILRNVDFTRIKVILLASPGFVKDDFWNFLLTTSVRQEDRPLIENKHKFVLCKASSGHKHALEDVLSDPAIMKQLTETKVAKEVEILNTFMRTLNDDPDRAYYGFHHVTQAQQSLAIESLLVTDELFRNSNVKKRKQYVQLAENVKEAGGHVYIFSSMHVSGQQLAQVSGVAAILRFPLPDLDELEELAAAGPEDDDKDDDEEEEYDPEKRIREDVADMGL